MEISKEEVERRYLPSAMRFYPPRHNLMLHSPTEGDCEMATEVRHCERCDHEFEVDVTSGSGEVEGCPESTADCGLSNPRERVRIVREID
jgi:hypothetical protein